MDRNIKVTIEDRVATAEGDPSVICGNSVYTVTFTFDDEWEDFEVKTARFKYLTSEGVRHVDQPFTGDTVDAPVLFDTREVEVGVYAGDLTTTTGATIRCTPSIRCGAGEEVEPEPDKYDALMDLIKNGVTSAPNPDGGSGGFSPIVNITEIEGGHRVTITDIDGEKTFDVLDGIDGNDYVLTEADKTEIANKVLNSLAVAEGGLY